MCTLLHFKKKNLFTFIACIFGQKNAGGNCYFYMKLRPLESLRKWIPGHKKTFSRRTNLNWAQKYCQCLSIFCSILKKIQRQIFGVDLFEFH